LDLFSVPPTQTSIEAASYCDYHPLTSIGDGSPIEFEISGTGEDYIDFSNTYLFVKAKITQANGANTIATDVVGPANYFLHSMFSQVDISLNGTSVTASTNTYPYRAVIEALLSYGSDCKESQLSAALFYKDTAGNMENVALDGANQNIGLVKRAELTTMNRVVDMMGRIHADIFFQDRYMISDVNIKIKLTRSKDAFCLMSDDEFAVKIVSAQLYVRKVKLSPSVYLAHARTLEQGTAKYPIKRVICKTFTVPVGFRDVTHEKLFCGQLPCRLVVGLVDNEAFNGAFNRNPFNFQHFNVSEIGVYLDGQQVHAVKALQPDYAHHQYVDAYMSLFSGSGKINRDEGNFIARTDFARGYGLYAYDLTPDLAENDHFNLTRQGNVRLLLKFSAALQRTVTVIAYAEFENVIEIDRSRNVIFDFGA